MKLTLMTVKHWAQVTDIHVRGTLAAGIYNGALVVSATADVNN